jgi:hypothetical protein
VRLNFSAFDVPVVLSLPCSSLAFSLFCLAAGQLAGIGQLLLYRGAVARGLVRKHSAETGRVSSRQSLRSSIMLHPHVPRHARLPNVDIVALTTAASPPPALAWPATGIHIQGRAALSRRQSSAYIPCCNISFFAFFCSATLLFFPTSYVYFSYYYYYTTL